MTMAFTPKSATNILVIEAQVFATHSAAGSWTAAALFRDTVANALAVGVEYQTTATAGNTIPVRHTMVSGGTSEITFKIRAGSHTPGTTTFNGTGGARLYGAITKSSIVVTEYKV